MNKWWVPVAVLASAILGWSVWQMRIGPGGDDAEPATEVAVHVGHIAQQTLRSYVTAYGAVAPRPSGDGVASGARMAPAVAGVVTTVHCVEGQRVAKDELLIELDSREADVALHFARKNLERERELWGVEGTSQQALQDAERQLEAATVRKALLQLRAPIAGTVVGIHVAPGEAVDPSAVVAEIVDLEGLVATAGVPAAELAGLHVGLPAQVIPDPPAAPVAATLDFIGYTVDPQTGLAEVRVNLPGDTALRPGQFVALRIVSEQHDDGLAVPEQSVVRGADGSARIAVVRGDVATLRDVSTGIHDGGLVEVTGEGLQAGMTVVTEGAYGLPDETRIRVIAD